MLGELNLPLLAHLITRTGGTLSLLHRIASVRPLLPKSSPSLILPFVLTYADAWFYFEPVFPGLPRPSRAGGAAIVWTTKQAVEKINNAN
jgi:hypothetical protein